MTGCADASGAAVSSCAVVTGCAAATDSAAVTGRAAAVDSAAVTGGAAASGKAAPSLPAGVLLPESAAPLLTKLPGAAPLLAAGPDNVRSEGCSDSCAAGAEPSEGCVDGCPAGAPPSETCADGCAAGAAAAGALAADALAAAASAVRSRAAARMRARFSDPDSRCGPPAAGALEACLTASADAAAFPGWQACTAESDFAEPAEKSACHSASCKISCSK